MSIPARFVYFLWAGLSSLFFSTYGTLSAIYRIEVAGLDALELILLGTALELSVFVFELPTGIVADVYSRRVSVIIGMVLIGLGFILEGALPVFAFMLVAQVVWGLGVTFESGAVDAWISDEIGEAKANAAFLRSAQIAQFMSLVGIGLATILAQLFLGLPLIVGGIGFLLLALLLIVVMPETGFERESDNSPLTALGSTFQAGVALVKRRPLVLTIFVITAILGASSETFDRLYAAHFIEDIGVPDVFSLPVWFGLIGAIVSLVSILATEIVRRRVVVNQGAVLARVLFALTLVLSICILGFAVVGQFYLALAFYGSAVLLRIVNAPLQRAWLNLELEPKTRATVFSMNGQMDALGQVLGGPILGVLARLYGMPLAFVLSGVLLLPALYLYRRSLKLK